jgi:hypothetical protein
MPDAPDLTEASPDDVEHAVAHALQFDGRKAFRPSGEMMARITAAHIAACLRRAGFVVMRKPPPCAHSYSPGLDRKPD